jgi:hypothetical protein
MSVRRLRVPALLVATTLAIADCSEPPSTDAATDNGIDSSIDACPDPLACVLDFTQSADGSITVIYRRDGSVSDVPCPAPPSGCPVA